MTLLTPTVVPSVPTSPPVRQGDVRTEEPRIYRLGVEQYSALVGAGVFTSEEPVELLEGLLVERMSKNPPHEAAMRKLKKRLPGLIPAGLTLDSQSPIALFDSVPEPDFSVVAESKDDYAGRHPSAAETLLVIEVAETSLRTDQSLKLRLYARAGIPEYWVVNLIDRRIEVYTLPDASAEPAVYNRREPYAAGTQVPLNLRGQPVGTIAVDDVMP